MVLIGGPEVAWSPASFDVGHCRRHLTRVKQLDLEIVEVQDSLDLTLG